MGVGSTQKGTLHRISSPARRSVSPLGHRSCPPPGPTDPTGSRKRPRKSTALDLRARRIRLQPPGEAPDEGFLRGASSDHEIPFPDPRSRKRCDPHVGGDNTRTPAEAPGPGSKPPGARTPAPVPLAIASGEPALRYSCRNSGGQRRRFLALVNSSFHFHALDVSTKAGQLHPSATFLSAEHQLVRCVIATMVLFRSDAPDVPRFRLNHKEHSWKKIEGAWI